MMRQLRPRTLVVASLVLAAVVGWGVAGNYLYKAFIGLDAAAFPAGWFFERVGQRLLPPAGFTIGGVTLALAIILAFAVATFVVVRRAARVSHPAPDGERRRFLAGAATGGVAALGTIAVGGAAAFSNAWLGLGRGGRGWQRPVGEIFEAPVPETHPEWLAAWKGSRVRAHRRLGRTDWMEIGRAHV